MYDIQTTKISSKPGMKISIEINAVVDYSNLWNPQPL